MPLTDISLAFVNSYHSNIQLKYQQMTSRIRDRVRVETQNSERDFYDRIGPTAVVEKTTRNADTPEMPDAYDRRAVTLRDFHWGKLIDHVDKLRMLADPTAPELSNAVASFGRQIDLVICQAAIGNAYTGKDGNTAVALPGLPGTVSSGQVIGVGYQEGTSSTANSNLTIGKLRKTMDLLKSAEAVEDNEPVNFICAQSQITSLLRTTEVTNSDFNTVKALADGTVKSFMGFNFIRTQVTTQTSDPYRQCLAFPQRGMLMALGEDITVKAAERADKSFSVQLYVKASFNATRMWEEQVVVVNCDETK